MIKDTCTCGAKFEIHSGASGEAMRHDAWLKAHEVCREAWAAREPDWPEPLSVIARNQETKDFSFDDRVSYGLPERENQND